MEWEVRVLLDETKFNKGVRILIFRPSEDGQELQYLKLENSEEFSIHSQERGSMIPTAFELDLDMFRPLVYEGVKMLKEKGENLGSEEALTQELLGDKKWFKEMVEKLIEK